MKFLKIFQRHPVLIYVLASLICFVIKPKAAEGFALGFAGVISLFFFGWLLGLISYSDLSLENFNQDPWPNPPSNGPFIFLFFIHVFGFFSVILNYDSLFFGLIAKEVHELSDKRKPSMEVVYLLDLVLTTSLYLITSPFRRIIRIESKLHEMEKNKENYNI